MSSNDDHLGGEEFDPTEVRENREALIENREVIEDIAEALNPLRFPLAWIVSLFTLLSLNEARVLLADAPNPPVRALSLILNDFLFQTILLPIGITVFNLLQSALDILLMVFFGGDRQVGILPGTFPGIVDIPFLVSRPVAISIFSFFGGIAATIRITNLSIANAIPTFGLAAPIVATAVLMVEIGVVAWAAWIGIRSVDVPFVQPVAFVMALTRPIRRLFDLLFR